MKHKIEKSSAEFEFFKELYVFRQEYYSPSTDEEYEILTKRVTELNKKYENEPFYEFVKGVLLAHLNDVNERSK